MAERPGTRMPVILDVDDPPVLRTVERDLSRRYARQYRGIRTKPGEAPVDALGRLKVRSPI